ncbi:MAG: hypothetical protein ACR2RE_02105, partial [Geminicoccaceae bacterium]
GQTPRKPLLPNVLASFVGVVAIGSIFMSVMPAKSAEAADLRTADASLQFLVELAQADPLVFLVLWFPALLIIGVGWRLLSAAVTILTWLAVAGVAAVATIILTTGPL